MTESDMHPPHVPSAPWFTVELDGVMLHVPLGEGKVFELPMTPEGLYALLGEGVEQFAKLKTDRELQKKIAGKLVDVGLDWLAKRWRK